MGEGYVIPATEIMQDIQRITKGEPPELPAINDVLYLASRFGNVELVDSLISAGADPSQVDASYYEDESPPSQPRTQSSPSLWFCGHCAGGVMSVAIDSHCSACGQQKDGLSRYE